VERGGSGGWWFHRLCAKIAYHFRCFSEENEAITVTVTVQAFGKPPPLKPNSFRKHLQIAPLEKRRCREQCVVVLPEATLFFSA